MTLKRLLLLNRPAVHRLSDVCVLQKPRRMAGWMKDWKVRGTHLIGDHGIPSAFPKTSDGAERRLCARCLRCYEKTKRKQCKCISLQYIEPIWCNYFLKWCQLVLDFTPRHVHFLFPLTLSLPLIYLLYISGSFLWFSSTSLVHLIDPISCTQLKSKQRKWLSRTEKTWNNKIQNTPVCLQ